MHDSVSNLGDGCFFKSVGGAIHSGNPVDHFNDVSQVPGLCVNTSPHFCGVNIDETSELLIDNLMLVTDQPN